MSETAENLKKSIIDCYRDMFGETTPGKRILDILEEAEELLEAYSPDNEKEELSDLVCTCFAMAAEKGWSIDELVQMNLDKLKTRRENGHYEKTGELKPK